MTMGPEPERLKGEYVPGREPRGGVPRATSEAVDGPNPNAARAIRFWVGIP